MVGVLEVGALTLHDAGPLDAEARDAYARILRHDPSGGLQSVDDMLRGAQLFEVARDDVIVGRYALRVDGWANGSEGVIAAASGHLPGVDFVATVLPVIHDQFARAGLDTVKVITARKALVNKLLQVGYSLDAFILRKRRLAS